ncbi:MAG: PfkB family carbohydrate kinase [Lachnospiraceae bacterium]|nr:PfkB family carbohydrate kinase [Lachnospiraceae bacterium]
MKNVLVIGSTVVDIIVNLHHLPKTCEDVHVLSQSMSLGGCAYNTSDILRKFQVPYILFSPVGTGFYGRFVREALAEKGIVSPIPTPDMDNGCCYCFVEHTGERTFISNHGAEYQFRPEWFRIPASENIDSVYICGLEIEEPTGVHIVRYLEEHPGYTVYFAPGLRILKISEELLERIFGLSPVLHLNETEALEYTGRSTVEQAARALYGRTGGTVIVTLGEHGAYFYSDEAHAYVSGTKAQQIDAIGAGDAHIGAVIAARKRGASWQEAIAVANRVSAAVVETKGALLPDEAFQKLQF